MNSRKRWVAIVLVVVAAGIVNSLLISHSHSLRKYLFDWYAGGEYQGKEGVIMQTRYNNCGPTALQMIFDYYKVPSTIDEIERNVHPAGNGTTMLALEEMAERKGLHAEGWRLTFSDFVNSTFPLLLFVRNDHFVVADSVYKDDVFLRDPSIGRVRMPKMNLLHIWKGEALVFSAR